MEITDRLIQARSYIKSLKSVDGMYQFSRISDANTTSTAIAVMALQDFGHSDDVTRDTMEVLKDKLVRLIESIKLSGVLRVTKGDLQLFGFVVRCLQRGSYDIPKYHITDIIRSPDDISGLVIDGSPTSGNILMGIYQIIYFSVNSEARDRHLGEMRSKISASHSGVSLPGEARFGSFLSINNSYHLLEILRFENLCHAISDDHVQRLTERFLRFSTLGLFIPGGACDDYDSLWVLAGTERGRQFISDRADEIQCYLGRSLQKDGGYSEVPPGSLKYSVLALNCIASLSGSATVTYFQLRSVIGRYRRREKGVPYKNWGFEGVGYYDSNIWATYFRVKALQMIHSVSVGEGAHMVYRFPGVGSC